MYVFSDGGFQNGRLCKSVVDCMFYGVHTLHLQQFQETIVFRSEAPSNDDILSISDDGLDLVSYK